MPNTLHDPRPRAVRRESRHSHRAQHATSLAAVLYARISLDREQTQLGVERQLKETRPHVKRMECRLVAEFVDNSRSALLGKERPEFDRMIELLETGAVSHLFCWHPDRLTRNQEETAWLIELLRRCSIVVVSAVAGTYDMSQATARHLFRMVASNATFESELKGERMALKHREIAEAGGTAGGPRPFGYTSSKRDQLDEHEAALLREATRRVLAGEPLNRIAREWNAKGYTTTNGRPWSATHLYGKLRTPSIAGFRVLHGETFEGRWEPIVSRKDFQRVVQLLSDPSRKKRSPDTPYLLHGVVVSEFGLPMKGKYAHGVRKYYSEGAPKGEGVFCDESDLDDFVAKCVFRKIRKHNGKRLPFATDQQGADERIRLAKRIEKLEAELTVWSDNRQRLEPDEYFTLTGAVRDELDAKRARLAELTPVDAYVRARLAEAGVAEREWDQLDTFERRDVIRAWVERVTVRKTRRTGPAARLSRELEEWPDRVTIVWRTK